MRFHHSLDMRYRGQAYELNIPAGGNILAGFIAPTNTLWPSQRSRRQVEIVNIRCRATGITENCAPRKSCIAAAA